MGRIIDNRRQYKLPCMLMTFNVREKPRKSLDKLCWIYWINLCNCQNIILTVKIRFDTNEWLFLKAIDHIPAFPWETPQDDNQVMSRALYYNKIINIENKTRQTLTNINFLAGHICQHFMFCLLIFSFPFLSHTEGVSLGFSHLNTIYLVKIFVFIGQVMSNEVVIFISFPISRIRLKCIKGEKDWK